MFRTFVRTVMLVGVISLTAAGCASPRGSTVTAKREYVRDMRDHTLTELYRKHPRMEERLKAAPGYGVFSNVGAQVIFVGGGYGYGVVRNNAQGKDTYMRVTDLDVGLGVGAKEFQAVFVFNDEDALDQFVRHGWEFGAETVVRVSHEESTGGLGGHLTVQNMDIYLVRETGLSVAAMLSGTKYWYDSGLN